MEEETQKQKSKQVGVKFCVNEEIKKIVLEMGRVVSEG